MSYYYLLRLSSFYSPNHCKCYLCSLVTPVYSLHVWTALFCWFNKLNDDHESDKLQKSNVTLKCQGKDIRVDERNLETAAEAPRWNRKVMASYEQ